MGEKSQRPQTIPAPERNLGLFFMPDLYVDFGKGKGCNKTEKQRMREASMVVERAHHVRKCQREHIQIGDSACQSADEHGFSCAHVAAQYDMPNRGTKYKLGD